MKKINCPNCNMELIPTEEEMYTVNPFDDEQYQHICLRQSWMCTNCGCDIETFNPIENEKGE